MFSLTIFQNNGISSQIYSLLNNEEFRPTTNLIISKCKAYDYLDNINPNLEKLPTNYYETFSITDRFTGYFSDITVGEFFNTLSSNSCDGTAVLGGLNKTAESSSSEKNVIINPENLVSGSSSIEGKRGSENIGLAVFDHDKLCGELTAMETICHLLIQNDVDSFIVSIDNPFADNEENKIDLSFTPTKNTKTTINIDNDIPNIYIDVNVQAAILTLENDIDYENIDNLELFSDCAEKYLEKEFDNYFNKISKQYNTDIDCFSTKSLSHFATKKDWENFNWKEKFKSANFYVNVKVNVISSQMITKT